MTNHWIDIGNSDCILIMGSNAAENHPISFRWVTKAKENGATLINVDPRFTRTSSKADIYAAHRSGTDIAFLGGMIKYILDNNKYFKDYVVHYTNAAFIVGEKFDFKDGLFSGYSAEKRSYDASSWSVEKDDKGIPKRDPTLENPRCVFQLLKKHYARYDLDTVSSITGTPKEDLLKVYEAYSATGAPDKAGTIMYAMGWTQHTVGVQNIRTMSMIQLLLGNMGIAGGGVNALRGESNVQGSTDQALLFHILPGYLPTPSASVTTLAEYNKKFTPTTSDPLSANWWQNRPKYMVSFLKSMYGDAAKPENDFGYSLLPKLEDGKSYSWLDMFDVMYRKQFTGFFAWGQNPACSGANAGKTRQALGTLDWMVTVNLFDNETSSFWKGPGVDPKKIKTEVFLLPCAAFMEKEGSLSNSGRWAQWRYKAQNPPGQAKPDGDIMVELFNEIRGLYKKPDKKSAFPDPIFNLKWDYTTNKQFDAHLVAKAINGYFTQDVTISDKTYKKGDLVPSFVMLKDDGSTSCGNWIYSQSYNQDGNNMARRDKTDDSGIGLTSKWSWCWPLNRRIIYNRASVDLTGKPWNPKKAVVEFVGEVKEGKYTTSKWKGDVPDGGWYPMKNPDGTDREDTKLPFIMRSDGVGALFGPGMKDGPFPEHYEPTECPVDKNPFGAQITNPVAALYGTDRDIIKTCDPRFPFVGTTYRVTEHWQTGVLTRWLPWLLEAEPQLFVEMSEELANLKGIKNGEKVVVESPRGKVEAVAIVTIRFKPFKILGQEVHQVGLPWHYGWIWPKDGGDSANLLTPAAGDPNTRIPETKAFMVNVRKKTEV
jgi:formate dehydrogenase major subunit